MHRCDHVRRDHTPRDLHYNFGATTTGISYSVGLSPLPRYMPHSLTSD